MLDSNGDPIQSGFDWRSGSTGTATLNGPVIGIVLSIAPSDSSNNLWFQMFEGEVQGTPKKAPYIEASVYVIFGGAHMGYILEHCFVAQGKCCKSGPSEDEPSDWTEDLPRGCTADEVTAFFADTSTGIDNLSGDWVIVHFLGGLLDLPFVHGWFPNPHNTTDSASKADGQRYLIRRNNSMFRIDKGGDIALTHREGQYLQFKGKSITLKHISGQLIHLSDNGSVNIVAKGGNLVTVGESSILFSNGKVVLQILDENIRLQAPSGEVNVTADKINLLADEVSAGVTGGSALCQEQMATDFSQLMHMFSSLITTLNGVPILAAVIAAWLLQPINATGTPPDMTPISVVLAAILERSGLPLKNYVSKVLSSA